MPRMKPQLIANAGPLKGQKFTITETALTFGRLQGDVIVEDDMVSRPHASFQVENGRTVLWDLGSTNGTFVNDETLIGKRVLRHLDAVKFGSTILIYMEHGDAGDEAPAFIEDDADRLRNVSTIKVVRDPPLFPDIDPIRAAALDLVDDVLPEAERTAVLLVGRNPEEGFTLASYRPEKFRPSSRVPHLAIQDGLPILSNDVNSVICVPLIAKGTRFGVLYAESSKPNVWEDRHLSKMARVANLASKTFEGARFVEWLEGQTRRLHAEIDIIHDMVGDSPELQKVWKFIHTVARSELSVVIIGETGTGKEMVFHAIHRNSHRSEGPCLVVNCGNTSEDLIADDLYGHEKDAFTGASTRKIGKVEAAAGGTLVFDEIGELPMAQQVRLLRLLQSREFERVGGTKTLKATSGLSRRRIATSKKWSNKDFSAKICTSGWLWPKSKCRR